jgi:hypothetical protein
VPAEGVETHDGALSDGLGGFLRRDSTSACAMNNRGCTSDTEITQLTAGASYRAAHPIQLEISLLAQADHCHSLGRYLAQGVQDGHLIWPSFNLAISHELADGSIQGSIHSCGSATWALDSLNEIDQNGIYLLVYYVANNSLNLQVLLLMLFY